MFLDGDGKICDALNVCTLYVINNNNLINKNERGNSRSKTNIDPK